MIRREALRSKFVYVYVRARFGDIEDDRGGGEMMVLVVVVAQCYGLSTRKRGYGEKN